MVLFFDLAIVLGSICVAAAFSFAWIRFSSNAPTYANTDSTPEADQIWLLFDGQNCKYASLAAMEALCVNDPSEISWENAQRYLAPRFVSFPDEAPDASCLLYSPEIYHSQLGDDSASLEISSSNNLCRVQIKETRPVNMADRHNALLRKVELSNTLGTMRKISAPIWVTSKDGKVLWKNKAYEQLERTRRKMGSSEEQTSLFSQEPHNSLSSNKERVSIALGPTQSEVHWYDLTSVEIDERRILHTALNVDSLINAETAQRKFVQTLAKTFAQLSTGLAIFDRERRLVLFNPALVDLTDLPAPFLSAQPNLQSFFDKLRDNRIMPEPKDYSSWRKRIADLVVRAEDGRYQDTWHLPNGLTYRIVGRPHPDGAIAILIEDISVEMSLTQRFKGQIELSNSVLENLKDAIVAFDTDGRVLLWNGAFRKFIGLPETANAASFDATTILRHWRTKMDTATLSALLAKHRGRKHTQEGSFILRDGRALRYRFSSQDGTANTIALFTSELSEPKALEETDTESLTQVG